ncbi:sensor histidine kinase [Saliphagus sp. GCM10025308]
MRPPSNGHRHVIENVPNGILVLFDDSLRYRIVGPRTLPFSGKPTAEMVGESLDELFPDETGSRLEPELRETLEGTSRSFDIEYDGRVHHVETKPVTIDDELYGVLLTQEVTEPRETAAELEAQNERLDQFASMVSHDLRNPLSIAFGELALYRETGDEDSLDRISDALERIDDLLLDLTILARPGLQSVDHGPVSIETVARDSWTMVETKDATLEVDDCTVTGNDGQLQALFENLFRNAIGHGGADVTVRVGPLADGFYVEDTGSGIGASTRERIFEHGFTTGYSGSGIGLTIVARVADEHGLEVALVESDEGGARFEFRPSSD